MHDLKGKVLRGGLAKLCGQGANSGLRLGFLVVLARLLEPQDFGLVAMVTGVTAVLDLFTTAGLSSAAIQRSTITDEQISTLFWINLLVGIILGLLCLLLAPLLVTFYHEPRLFWVTVAMGAAFVFSSAGVQQNAHAAKTNALHGAECDRGHFAACSRWRRSRSGPCGLRVLGACWRGCGSAGNHDRLHVGLHRVDPGPSALGCRDFTRCCDLAALLL